MKQDRFLVGILIFIGVLVVAALALFFVRNRAPAYRPEDTPEGVVYNYVVALQLKDYPRAYSYLAQKDHRPSLNSFEQVFLAEQLNPGNAALQVADSQILPDGDAWVNLIVQYAGGGVFDRGSSVTERAALIKQGGAWKITSMPYPYWGFDWYTPTPPPVKTP